MTRIVVAGGSVVERAALCAVLHEDPFIETAALGPSLANVVVSAQRLQPDLIVLMMGLAPEDAIEAARAVMGETPKPVVLVSPGKLNGIEALLARSGALAALEFPALAAQQGRFVATLKAMAEVKVVRRWRRDTPPRIVAAPARGPLVAIAASTGGPGALLKIFSGLPADFAAPIVVVQHIAGGFADSLVKTLGGTHLTVQVARDGEALKPATVYIGPDDRHLGVSSRNTVALSATPPIEGFRPSATFLFESAARAFGPHLTAVVLTGMGRDGVAGLPLVRERGGTVIAQDRETSAVFGMPKAAVENGCVNRVLPLGDIARELAACAPREGVSA
jgi:two-component system chemotaxis response regulator CheB